MAGFINAFGGNTGYSGRGPSSVVGSTLTNEGFQLQKPFLEDLFGSAGEFYFDTTKDGSGVETKTLRVPEQYRGETIAGFDPTQERAFGFLEDIGAGGLAATGQAGSGQYMTEATNLADLAVGKFDDAAAEEFINPYLQNVTRQAEDEVLRRYQSEIEPRLGAEAAAAGAFGGSRAAIMESEGQRNLLRQIGDIRERGLAAGFDQGRRAFEAQKAREQGLAGFYGQLAESAPRIGAMEAGLVSSVGEQRRGLEQARLDRAEKEFIEARDAPIRQLAGYQSILQGFPYSPSTYEVKSTYSPQPSFSQQLIGGLGAAGSLYGAFGGFNPAGNRKRGGLVRRRSGGQVQGGLAGLERHADISYTRKYGTPRGSSRDYTGIPMGTGIRLSEQIKKLIGHPDIGGPHIGNFGDRVRKDILGLRPDSRDAEIGYRVEDYIRTLSPDEDIEGFIERLNQTGEGRFGKGLDISQVFAEAGIPLHPPVSKARKEAYSPRRSTQPLSGSNPFAARRAATRDRTGPFDRSLAVDPTTSPPINDYIKQVEADKARTKASAARLTPETHGAIALGRRLKAKDEENKQKQRVQKYIAEAKASLNASNYGSDFQGAFPGPSINYDTAGQTTEEIRNRLMTTPRSRASRPRADWDDDRPEVIREQAELIEALNNREKLINVDVALGEDVIKKDGKEVEIITTNEVKEVNEKYYEDPPPPSGVGPTDKIEVGDAQVKKNEIGIVKSFYEDPSPHSGVEIPISKGDPKAPKKSDPMDKYFQEYIDALSNQPTGEQELTEADERLQRDMWLSLAAAFGRFGSTGHAGGIVPAFLKEIPKTIEDVKKAQKAYREDQKYANKQNALVAKDKLTADLARQNIFLKRMGVKADMISANAALLKAGMMDQMDYQDFTRMLVQFTDDSNLSQLTTQKILAEAMRRVQEDPRNLSKVLNDTYQWVEKNHKALGIRGGDLFGKKTGGTPSQGSAQNNAAENTAAALEKLKR